jgi:formylglycine-generating enzyme required for sulfatase activity
VIRGGDWYYDAGECRSADRDYYFPGGRDGRIGFRVVLAPGQP